MQPTLPGYGLITAILHAGGHVIARVKEGISLDFADSENRGCLPDGSRPRRHWTRSPQRPTQPSALPCTPSTSPGGSGTPGARRRHARNSRTLPPPRPPSQGNLRSPCSRTRLLLAPARPGSRQEGGNAPPRGGAGPWNRPPFPPRHAGPGHALTPSGNRLSCICGTRTPQHLRKPETPKVGGVATKWGFKSRHGALADIILGCPRVRSACRFG